MEALVGVSRLFSALPGHVWMGFERSKAVLSASRRVSETASSAQNRPRSILHRFFVDCGSIFVHFRKTCRRVSLEPPVTKAQNRNLKKQSCDHHRASRLLRGAVLSHCSHAFRHDFRTLHIQPFFIEYLQVHLLKLHSEINQSLSIFNRSKVVVFCSIALSKCSRLENW